jgi:GntR family transcriptional regulator
LIELNYRDGRPIYEQVKDGFKKLILSGALQEGEKLPSVRELSTLLAVNPNTIQRAYRELEAEGCVFSAPARGTFAASPNALREEKKASLMLVLRETASALRALGVTEEEIHRGLEEIKDD